MWLARAYGLKAQHANPIAALSLARKVHAAFERAVALDPNNAQALSDLGEYFVEAPALIGGGLDRAHSLAARMMPSFPARAHRLLAMAAEKNNDLPTAEAEYQNAVAAEKSPAAYIDLGNFYAHHTQHDKMLAALQNGIDADHRRDSSLVDAASILASAHAEPQLAESLLRRYLASPAKSDDAPAFKVHLQLGFILAARGDQPDAQREFSAAHALAPDYAPARKAVEGS
jgi:tetratricopeptide (TPR) repeat protein